MGLAGAWGRAGSQAPHAPSPASDCSMRSRQAASTSRGDAAPDLRALRAPERVVNDGKSGPPVAGGLGCTSLWRSFLPLALVASRWIRGRPPGIRLDISSNRTLLYG